MRAPKTLVVLPGYSRFRPLKAIAERKYPGARVVYYGEGLGGMRLDRIVAVLAEPYCSLEARHMKDWMRHLPTKLYPKGTFETVTLDKFLEDA